MSITDTTNIHFVQIVPGSYSERFYAREAIIYLEYVWNSDMTPLLYIYKSLTFSPLSTNCLIFYSRNLEFRNIFRQHTLQSFESYFLKLVIPILVSLIFLKIAKFLLYYLRSFINFNQQLHFAWNLCF